MNYLIESNLVVSSSDFSFGSDVIVLASPVFWNMKCGSGQFVGGGVQRV